MFTVCEQFYLWFALLYPKRVILQYDISPQSSQEQELSQLSRTTSDASSQSSTTQNAPEYSATVFTMKRTISLKKSAVPKGVLSPKWGCAGRRIFASYAVKNHRCGLYRQKKLL